MDKRLFYSPQFFDVESSNQPTNLTKKFLKKDNNYFLAAVAKDLANENGNSDDTPVHAADGEMAIGLIGSYGLFGYGLRRSQEILRLDRGPSYWSHAFLFNGGLKDDAKYLSSAESPWLLECTLRPSATLSDALYRDGVMPRRIAEYAPSLFDWNEANSVPNFAVISLGLTKTERAAIRKAALTPEMTRQQYGLSALAGQWFHYLTDKGEMRNPLTLGQPMHSAAYVQMAYSAAGIDLAPSASQHTVAPEHFWSFAKWLQPLSVYLEPSTHELKQRPLRIWICIREPHCLISADTLTETPSALSLEDIIKT